VSGDIVERLRGHIDSMCMNNIVCGDAADEIERLRAEVERQRSIADTAWRKMDDAINERTGKHLTLLAERALADQLAEALCQIVTWSCCPDSNFGPCNCAPDDARIPEGTLNAAAIAAWKEARRG